MTKLCILFLLVVFVCKSHESLYSLILEQGSSSQPRQIYTVEVDPSTGNFTKVIKNLAYEGLIFVLTPLSAFDQTNQWYYFEIGFPLIMGVDVGKGELLAPFGVSENLEILWIIWDGGKQQLLFTTIINNIDIIISSYTNDNGFTQLANLTSFGIGTNDIGVTTLFWQKEIFYFIYTTHATPKDLIHIGWTSLSSSSNYTNNVLSCQDTQFFSIFYDFKRNVIASFGFNTSDNSFVYVEILQNGQCIGKSLLVLGADSSIYYTASTYDPTITTLYVSLKDDNHNPPVGLLWAYDVIAQKLVNVTVSTFLGNIQASYKI